MAHINKIYRFIENTSTIRFPEKKDTLCKNSKTRMLVLSEYIYFISCYFMFVEPFRLKPIKKRSNRKKTHHIPEMCRNRTKFFLNSSYGISKV